MVKKHKVIIGGFLVVAVFFVVTFAKNWGTAVSENLLEKYKPEIKNLKNKPSLAILKCPIIIKRLEKGIPELSKSKDKTQVPKAQKLIADCAFAAGDYSKALEYYNYLSNFEPNVALWHAQIAESYLKQDRLGDALHPSILATQLDPTEFKFWLLNARVLVKLGLKNRAIDAYAHAIKIAPYESIQPTKLELEDYIGYTENADASLTDGEEVVE